MPGTLMEWAAEHDSRYAAVLEVIGAPPAAASIDVIPHLQRFLAGLPLAELEQSDWVTLHADLAAYLARHAITTLNASWKVRPAPNSPRGHRYVLVAPDPSGFEHFADPYAVVAIEFREPELEVIRLLATLEATLRAPDTVW